MCGIIGYVGTQPAKEILLDSLELLEYRGYDSAGIAVLEGNNLSVYKCAGRVADLRNVCKKETITGHGGIGHTRWATHGGVCDENAHPHKVGRVTLVHNGIIENCEEIKEKYKFTTISETDTEVAAALFDYYYENDPVEAIKKTVAQVKGTFAFVLLFEGEADTVYSIRNVSPIVAAATEDGAYLASDVTAIGRYTDHYFVVPEYTVLKMTTAGITLTSLEGETVEPEEITINWELNMSSKAGYPFYMEKEIMEQPQAMIRTMENRLKDGKIELSKEGITDEMLAKCDNVCLIACGTAMHAGLVCQQLLKKMVHIPVTVELASEYMYSDPVITDTTLVIAVSQSGETIDTLEALKYAKRHGAMTMAVLNVKGSSISREAHCVLYTEAGPEIAVASTKAYTTQLTAFFLFAGRMAWARGCMTQEEMKVYVEELQKIPTKMEAVLARKEEIHHIADKILNAKDLFMIGRGMDSAITLEGSLKLKEISYIHSESYAAGELKHGPLALITSHTPVIAVATQEHLLSKEISNIREVRSRGAEVVLFVKESMAEAAGDEVTLFTLPNCPDEMMCLPAAVALQLMAYYVSSDKGFDVDKPRNLAKVVTVE